MIPCLLRNTSALVLLAAIHGSFLPTTQGQTVRAPLNRGFARSSSVMVSVEEMLGTRRQRDEGEPILGPGYPALWIAEVQFKPPRLIRMQVTDPATKKTSHELVWYMIYRVISRDYTDLAGSEEAKTLLRQRLSDEAVDPQNPSDRVLAENLLMPRFVLQTTDEGSEHVYEDEINPQIQQEIFTREFRGDARKLRLLSSVDAISNVESQVPADDPNALDRARYGIAIWRNVDPDTDFFRIEMHGFSNGYRLVPTEDGKIRVEDKCIVQEFARPGDRIRQEEKEFRVNGNPQWVYIPRDAEFDVPEAVSVLRNSPAVQ